MSNKESNKVKIGTILSSIKNAMGEEDVSEITFYLKKLIEQDSQKWLDHLLISGIVPEPDSRNFIEIYGRLLQAISGVISSELVSAVDIANLLISLGSLHLCFKTIREELEELNLWEKPGFRIVLRLASFTEDQIYIAEKLLETETDSLGYFNPMLVASNIVPTLIGGPKASVMGGYEENCENLKLILDYSLYRFGEEFSGSEFNYESPYHDEAFSRLLALASSWRMYKYVWALIKYMNWTVQTESRDNTSVELYRPIDYQEFVRFEIGTIRMQEILSEISLSFLSEFPIKSFSDESGFREEIASSISLPDKGQVWDCNLNLNALRKASKNARNAYFVKVLLNQFRYSSLLEGLTVGQNSSEVLWKTYTKVRGALEVLAKVIFDLMKADASKSEPAAAVQNGIIVAEKIRLAQLLANASELSLKETLNALSVLTYNPNLKYLELWDTPLIELNSTHTLLIPSLIIMGSPLRNVENMISQWNSDLFKERGKLLEIELRGFLANVPNVQVQSPVVFQNQEGIDIECDLIALWEGNLIFVEAKCTKGVFSPADMYRARQHTVNCMSQLVYRRDSALANWEKFRSAANSLSLPELPLSYDKIKLLAVTNLPHFAGWIRDDVIVTDEFCIRRFFGPAEVGAYNSITGELIDVVDRIREGEMPSAEEFFSYLEHPPQVAVVQEQIRVEPLWLPRFKESDPVIGMLYASYNAPEYKELVQPRRSRKTSRWKSRKKRKGKGE